MSLLIKNFFLAGAHPVQLNMCSNSISSYNVYKVCQSKNLNLFYNKKKCLKSSKIIAHNYLFIFIFQSNYIQLLICIINKSKLKIYANFHYNNLIDK